MPTPAEQRLVIINPRMCAVGHKADENRPLFFRLKLTLNGHLCPRWMAAMGGEPSFAESARRPSRFARSRHSDKPISAIKTRVNSVHKGKTSLSPMAGQEPFCSLQSGRCPSLRGVITLRSPDNGSELAHCGKHYFQFILSIVILRRAIHVSGDINRQGCSPP